MAYFMKRWSQTLSRACNRVSVRRTTRLHCPLQLARSMSSIPFDENEWMKQGGQDFTRGHQSQYGERFGAFLGKHAERVARFHGKHTALHEELFAEMQDRVEQHDASVPEQVEGDWFYVRSPATEEFPIYCRARTTVPFESGDLVLQALRNGDGRVTEQVLVDQNVEGRPYPYIHIKDVKISVCKKFVAFSRDTDGTERWNTVVRSLSNDRLDEILEGAVNFVWLEVRGRPALMYTVADDKYRTYEVKLHLLGEDQAGDLLIYEERDDQCFVDVTRTKDGRYICVCSNSKTSSEVYLYDTERDPSQQLHLIRKREAGLEYFVDHAGSMLFAVTNDNGAEDYKLLCREGVGDSKSSFNEWRTLIPHEDGVKFEDVDVFREFIVCYVSCAGRSEIRIFSMRDLGEQCPKFRRVPLPMEHGVVFPGLNISFNASKFRFGFSSPITPPLVFDYDLQENHLKCLRATNVQNYDPALYAVHRVLVPSLSVPEDDGSCREVEVPLTLITREDGTSSSRPALVDGYGAYGHDNSLDFHAHQVSLLDRGWVLARSHVRGGGEIGRAWHKGGRKQRKQNSFNDFIACARYIQSIEGVDPCRLAAMGVSAGGLLVAASVNQCPSLFKAAILKVPFVSVLDAMTDSSLPLTVHEYDEWGSPEEPEMLRAMQQYDPYLNIPSNTDEYPALYITACLQDIRVPIFLPSKYVARVEQRQSRMRRALDRVVSREKVLFDVDRDSAHGVDGGRVGTILSAVADYKFLLNAV